MCFVAPSQQPPPMAEDITSTSIALHWAAPDYPNGVIIGYFLFRDGELIEHLGHFCE